MAEREGFEPPGPFGPTVFKTVAIDHSATSPETRTEKSDADRRVVELSSGIRENPIIDSGVC
jgi:hypothetical protein